MPACDVVRSRRTSSNRSQSIKLRVRCFSAILEKYALPFNRNESRVESRINGNGAANKTLQVYINLKHTFPVGQGEGGMNEVSNGWCFDR